MWMRRWTRPMSRTLPPLRGVSWVDMFRSPAGPLAPAVRARHARSSARNGARADVSKAASYEQAVGLSASRHANVPETSHDASDCAADAGGRPGVQIGCIRLSTAVVSGRLASPRIAQFAASSTTGDDWTLPLTFSDKEEVPGSSPGSPITYLLTYYKSPAQDRFLSGDRTPSSMPRPARTRSGAATVEPILGAPPPPSSRARNFRPKTARPRVLGVPFAGLVLWPECKAQTDASRIDERERGGHTGDRARERGGSTKRLSVLGVTHRTSARPQRARIPTGGRIRGSIPRETRSLRKLCEPSTNLAAPRSLLQVGV